MDSLAADAATLRGWTPVRVRTAESGLLVDWALLSGDFSDPFFEQTVDRAMRHPFNEVFARRTAIATLDALREIDSGVEPTGFIFHMSRCGSTLIAQMLAQLSSTTVLSEAQPFDALLRLRRPGHGPREDTLVTWLRGMMSALAQRRDGQRRLFVKFNAWHVLELPFVARAFPHVPWIFAFREPRAVLRSHDKIAGLELMAGALDPAYVGLDVAGAHAMAPGEYGARVLAAFCEAALRYAGIGRAAFVEYSTLGEIVPSSVMDFFGVTPSSDEVHRVRAVTRLNSKRPETLFQPPAESETPAEINRLAARWLDAPYAALRAAAMGLPPLLGIQS